LRDGVAIIPDNQLRDQRAAARAAQRDNAEANERARALDDGLELGIVDPVPGPDNGNNVGDAPGENDDHVPPGDAAPDAAENEDSEEESEEESEENSLTTEGSVHWHQLNRPLRALAQNTQTERNAPRLSAITKQTDKSTADWYAVKLRCANLQQFIGLAKAVLIDRIDVLMRLPSMK